MKTIVRAAAISVLAMLAVLQTVGEASAGNRLRMRVLWPKIYAPHVSGYLYRDESDDEDVGFFDPEDEEDIWPRRRHRDRNVVLEYDDLDEDYEPVYEPPVKRVVKPKAKKSVAAKKPVVKAKQATTVVKPKSKPVVKPAASASQVAKVPPARVAIAAKAPVSTSAIKANPVVASAALAAPAQKVAPKPAAPAAVKVASAAAPVGVIACSKGAEIVSGYGFTSVKPRACTGSTYSFDASRAANAYVIKVSAATGEITDVQKLK